MTYEEKVAWLRRYQASLRREQELAEEVEQLRARACRVTSALRELPGAAGDGQAMPRAVEQILQAQQLLHDQVTRCEAIRKEILAVLDRVADPIDRELLRRRYILGQRWEYISEKMYLDRRWIARRHRRALEALPMTIESPY